MSELSRQRLIEVDFPIRRVFDLPSPRIAGVSVDATRADTVSRLTLEPSVHEWRSA